MNLYDADDLRLLDSLSGNWQPACAPRLGNDFILNCFRGRILIQKIRSEPRPLELPMMESQKGGYDWPISDDALAVITGSRMAILNTDGQLLFTDTPPKRHFFFPSLATTARDRGRFAAEIGRMRGLTIPSLDMYAFQSAGQLRVYSLQKQKSIFVVKLNGASPWIPKIILNSFALSPDGSLLAILTNDLVRVYKLP